MNPYKTLDEKYFWSTAVAKRNFFDIGELWDPKFRINRKHQVATFGSCFAQHIGRALETRGFNWMISEAAPVGLSAENAQKFNYKVFTARTGNIYTVSLLRQWVDWSLGEKAVPDEIWEKNGRFFDPFRPNIEPDGFSSVDELKRSRNAAISAFRRTLLDADFFVFTLGLTESWINKTMGFEYPMCPGTVAGDFDPAHHQFVNQAYNNIRPLLMDTIRKVKKVNRKIRFILTVSPVPLTATMSGNHVLLATMESKSILRAVAGAVTAALPFVDYFPSYEIINSPPFRGAFFEANQRNVNHVGVEHVMNNFFNCLIAKFPGLEKTPSSPRGGNKQRKGAGRTGMNEVCEEELLNAFSRN